MPSDDKAHAGPYPIQQWWVTKGSAGEVNTCRLSTYCVPGSKPEPFTSSHLTLMTTFKVSDTRLVSPKRKLGGVRAVR